MIVHPSAFQIDMLKSDLVRSPGVHASEIFGDLFKRLEPKRYDFGDGLPNAPLMALGTAWEEHLERLLHFNGIDAHRPGEFMSPEGIAYSPDLLVFNGVSRVGEIKLTSMKLDALIEELKVNGVTNVLDAKFDKFLCQLKLYTYWMGWSHGWLAIMSIWKPYAPEFLALDIEFSARELQDNYTMLMNHWRYMQKEARRANS